MAVPPPIASPEAAAARVLAALDLWSHDRLVRLADDERREAFEALEAAAQAVVAGLDLTEEGRALCRERTGALALNAQEAGWAPEQAAALLALAHDETVGKTSHPVLVERLFLAQALVASLAEQGWSEADRLQDAADFAQKLAAEAKALPMLPKALEARVRELRFWLHRFAALNYQEVGDAQRSIDHFDEAALLASSVDDRLSCVLQGVDQSLARGGDKQRGYDLLCLYREDAEQIKDPEVREYWDAVFGDLARQLGAELGGRLVQLRTPALSQAQELTVDLLRQNPGSSSGSFEAQIAFCEKALAGLDEPGPSLRHDLHCALAYSLHATGRHEEGDLHLELAERLEPLFNDERSVVKRLVLVARLLKHRGRVREAIVALGEIEERARASLEAGEELAFLGDYLEALAAGGRGAELERVPVLVGRLRELLAQELGKQPGPAGRRRARETYQRPIESALGALLASAERVGLDTQEGERLLAQAWDLALATRNPELSLQRTATAAPDVAAGLQEKEDGAHALLRQWLVVDAQEAEAAWQQALEDLLDQEVRVLRAPGRPVQSSAQLDNQAFGLTLFLFRDLFPKPRLVALWQAPGSFGLQFLEPAVLESLERAAQGEQGQERPGSTRGFGREGASTALAPPVYELLPEDAGLALERRAPAAEGDPALPAYPLPWYLFPDGFLHSLDFEMLPEGPAEAPRFGQGRAISLCLRSSPPQAVAERVDFRRGWLGLGGIDYPSTFEPLEATAAEVQGIAGQLGRAGHPATWLLGPEANAARLEERLGASRPSVLHFATHGHADSRHPDACCLVLADCPERPERELLSFRCIRRLPLEGVQLVVLSACQTLVGRSGRSAGMEGLAWAFLEAGVTQVIASRRKVGDSATARFMRLLYRHLLEAPVAEALGRARDEALRVARLRPEDIAAWSVWC